MRLWLFVGSSGPGRTWQAELDLADPVLIDEDESTSQAYFIANDTEGFAQNPRHFVIDRDGILTLVGRTVSPEELTDAINEALASR